MTHLKCPLCGRLVDLTRFNPSTFDLDIYAVKLRGLGRGQGFTVDESFSLLTPGNNTVKQVKDRIIELCKLLMKNGYLTPKEVRSKLKTETVLPIEVRVLKDEIATLESEAEESNTRFNQKIGRCPNNG